MWCSTCQQDTSPAAVAEAAGAVCAKCGQVLTPNQVADKAAAKPLPARPLAIADDWELEADLRSVQRLIGSLKATGPAAAGAAAIHAPHESAGGWHRKAAEADVPRSAADAPRSLAQDEPRPKSHFLAWAILSVGLATFACGAVLLGWSFAGGRDDLWPLGMPLALIGQAGLIIGLVLQLDGLWQSNRQTARTLSQLDGELSRVRHATTLLSTSRTAPAQSFYVHLAEGAAPQLLLADLKGQLDLLAQQMASQRKG